jgi:cytochrome c oxidase cbb3-type subunit 3
MIGSPGSTRGALAAIAVLAVLASGAACERERRTFSEPGPSARPATAQPLVSLFPGEDPLPGAALDLALPGYAETAQAVSDGKQLYSWFNCVGCHLHGGGGIGPALIDDRWTYGSAPSEIATSIVAGRPMGMPSYRGKIAPTQLYQLVAYVRSLGALVRSDAVQARDEHIKTAPAQTLQHRGVPLPGKVRPDGEDDR